MKKSKKIISASFLMIILSIWAAVSISNTAAAKPECNYPDVYDPVYIIETGEMFTNACFASCAGYEPEDWTSGI